MTSAAITSTGTNQTDTGLPEGWRETLISEIGKVVTGKTPKKADSHHWGNKLDFVTPTDFTQDEKYLSQIQRKLSDEGESAFEKIIIPQDSVMVTCIGSDMGKVAKCKNRSLTNQQINSVIVNQEKYDPDFTYYALANAYNRLKTLASGGSTMPILNKSTFENFQILTAPPPTQRRIAAILSCFDDKIDLLRRQNKTLEAVAQTLFRRWFVEFNFPDTEGKPYRESGGKMVESELGEIPEGWGARKLSDIAEISSGKRPSNVSETKIMTHQVPLIGASKVMGYVEEALLDDKLFVTGRVGTHGVINKSNGPVWPSDNTLVVKPKKYSFVFNILITIDYSKMNKGGVQPLLTQTDLKNTPVIIPSEALLNEFEKVTLSFFLKEDKNDLQIQSLIQLRDTLLPRLVGGNISV